MAKTYVTNITDFLDKAGELAEMPRAARKMASFLVLLIDATTEALPVREFDTRIRCKTTRCQGSIRSLLHFPDEITWRCPDCGLNGVIRNWEGTKWDHTKPNGAEPRGR